MGHRIMVSYPKGRSQIASENKALKMYAFKTEEIMWQ